MSDHLSASPEESGRRRREGGERPDPALEYPDLEHSELDRRLRSLSWPAAPEGVKRRIFESLLEQRPTESSPDQRSEEDVREVEDLTIASERVHRHELSRRRLEVLSERVLRAPHRERRYAAVL